MTTLLKTLALLIAASAPALAFAEVTGAPLPAGTGEFALSAFALLTILAVALRDYTPRRALVLPPSVVARHLRVTRPGKNRAPFDRALAA